MSNIISALSIDNICINRNNWRHICDFVYSPSFNPERVFPGAKIFITGHNVQEFFRGAHPYIRNPYFLISMDGGVEPTYLNESNVIAWFANESYQPALDHSKFRLIPLGFSSESGSYQSNLLEQFRSIPKTYLMYMNFNITEYGSRREIYALYKDRPYVRVGSLSATNRRIDFIDYMRETAQSKFTISPIGDSFDCYRHWETIMVGSIPIIMRGGPCDPLFEGLPILLIDRWDELTEEFLNAKYIEISSKKYDVSKLYMRYWADIINKEVSAWKIAHT